jgi:hypothetical protein
MGRYPKYSKEVMDFISNNVSGTTTRDLAELINAKFDTSFTESSMKSYKSNHDLKSGTKCGLPAGQSKVYSPEVQDFIKKNIVGSQISTLTDTINSKFNTGYQPSQIRAYVKNHGLSSGLDFRIPKGNIPVNKGKKKWWVGGEETQFKKGSTPHNYMPVGSERVNTDGYHDIKIADPNKWKAKHIILWEEKYGPIPKDHVLIFGDGNKDNVSIDNLILVTRVQLAVLNCHIKIQKDVELTRTGIAIADLKTKISQRRR